MTKTRTKPVQTHSSGFVLGRKGFAKISAVEGISLSPEMEARFREFDQKGLTATERRQAIVRSFARVR